MNGDKPGKPSNVQILTLGHYLTERFQGPYLLIGDSHFDYGWPGTTTNAPFIKQLSDLKAAAEWIKSEPVRAGKVQETVAIISVNEQPCLSTQTLGEALRLFPQGVIAYTLVPAISDNTFFSLGFRRLSRIVATDHSDCRFFEYRLSQYKPSPDWLNAKYWANPERFDLEDDIDAYVDEEE